jgi:hypothetical protein
MYDFFLLLLLLVSEKLSWTSNIFGKNLHIFLTGPLYGVCLYCYILPNFIPNTYHFTSLSQTCRIYLGLHISTWIGRSGMFSVSLTPLCQLLFAFAFCIPQSTTFYLLLNSFFTNPGCTPSTSPIIISSWLISLLSDKTSENCKRTLFYGLYLFQYLISSNLIQPNETTNNCTTKQVTTGLRHATWPHDISFNDN